MKKYFNKKKFDSRPKRKGDRRTEQGEKPKWGKDNTQHDKKERSSGGYGERRNDERGRKGYGEKRKAHDFNRGEREGNQKDNREQTGGNKYGERKKFGERREESKPWEKRQQRDGGGLGYRRDYKKKRDDNLKKAFDRSEKKSFSSPNGGGREGASSVPASTGLIRLNKYLSNAGICSRREADTFIEAGAVKVNGKIITQLGYKVSPGDKVQFGENAVHKEKSVYILLNKPKGYITTTDDERDRATVLDLIHGVEERIYPVGRLDRNTSGLLLLTNDGDLATKLMRPKYMIPKVYHVELDKPLKPDDIDKIKNGIELEDGFIKPDDIAYVEGTETKKEIGIEIHSGRNRIVRRIFESLGYIVIKLDRVLYAGLTKKNLPRGKWRILADNEVRMLKTIK